MPELAGFGLRAVANLDTQLRPDPLPVFRLPVGEWALRLAGRFKRLEERPPRIPGETVFDSPGILQPPSLLPAEQQFALPRAMGPTHKRC